MGRLARCQQLVLERPISIFTANGLDTLLLQRALTRDGQIRAMPTAEVKH